MNHPAIGLPKGFSDIARTLLAFRQLGFRLLQQFSLWPRGGRKWPVRKNAYCNDEYIYISYIYIYDYTGGIMMIILYHYNM